MPLQTPPVKSATVVLDVSRCGGGVAETASSELADAVMGLKSTIFTTVAEGYVFQKITKFVGFAAS